EARGAVVARVYPNGPAAAAGIEKNDVVVSFEGTPVEDYRQLQRLSADAEVGKTVKLEIFRNRERRTIQLRAAEAPARLTPDRPPPPPPPQPPAPNQPQPAKHKKAGQSGRQTPPTKPQPAPRPTSSL